LKQKNFNSYQILEPVLTLQSQNTDIKYQNIIYCMINRNKKVSYNKQASIDFVKAVNELKSLDWTYQNNGISFINLKNTDGLFCSKIKDNKWLVLTAVLDNGVYHGYQWASYPNTRSLIHTVKLFFEETTWFYTQSWNRIKYESELVP